MSGKRAAQSVTTGMFGEVGLLHGTGVAPYVARYLRGGSLNHSRWVSLDPERVRCLYRGQGAKAGGGAQAVMRLAITDFFHRLFLHVPPRLRGVRR
jgi:Putative transposase